MHIIIAVAPSFTLSAGLWGKFAPITLHVCEVSPQGQFNGVLKWGEGFEVEKGEKASHQLQPAELRYISHWWQLPPPASPASLCFLLLPCIPVSSSFPLFPLASLCFLMLPLVSPCFPCFPVFLPASLCFPMPSQASSCFLIPPCASPCFFLVSWFPWVPCASSFISLLPPVSTCIPLHHPASPCLPLLPPATSWIPLLPLASSCFLPFPTVFPWLFLLDLPIIAVSMSQIKSLCPSVKLKYIQAPDLRVKSWATQC